VVLVRIEKATRNGLRSTQHFALAPVTRLQLMLRSGELLIYLGVATVQIFISPLLRSIVALLLKARGVGFELSWRKGAFDTPVVLFSL